MAKGNKAALSFEDVLATVTGLEPSDREVLNGIASRVPDFKQAVISKSEFSRNMDEVRDELQFAEQMRTWREENWVPDATDKSKGFYKRELAAMDETKAAKARAEQLEAQIAQGADVNFNDVLKGVTDHIESRGFVDSKTLAEKEALMNNGLNGYAHVATKGLQLGLQHLKDYNEVLDVDAVVKHANEKSLPTLDAAYGDMMKDRIAQKNTADLEAKLAAAREEGRLAAVRNTGMGSQQMPNDDGQPQMGHLQRKLLNLDKAPDGAAVPDNVELGKGVGALAARAADAKEHEQRT